MATKKSKNKKSSKNLKVLVSIAIIIVLLVVAAKYFNSDEKLAATVNGEKILKEDVLAEYIKVPPEYRTLMTVDTILEGMVIETLLLQEAEKIGISVTDEKVDDYTLQILQAYGLTEENLTKSLEESGSNMEELKASFKKRLIINELLNLTILSEIEVSDAEVRNYYDKNKNQFGTPAQVKASHILVATEEELESIRNKALGGADFAELAKEYSTCPSSAQGGDLGWFERGQMVKEFEDVAFSLKVGHISEIVQTQYGFHIIKLTDKKEGSIPSFDEIKDEAEQTVLNQKQSFAVEIYTQQLRSSADVEIFMQSVKEPEGRPLSEIIQEQKEAKAAEEIETAEPEESTESEMSVVECLVSKNAKMYGSDDSSTSNDQKALFGDDFAQIDYTDCSLDKGKCDSAKITSYPTWVISGKKYTGKYSLTRLAELAECS